MCTMGVNGAKTGATAPPEQDEAQHSCCKGCTLMSLGNISPREGALSRPLACTRENSRPSGPVSASRWHGATFQGPVSTTALACPTSGWWHMNPILCADRDAQLRRPCPTSCLAGALPAAGPGTWHFHPLFTPQTTLICPCFRVPGLHSCAPFSP